MAVYSQPRHHPMVNLYVPGAIEPDNSLPVVGSLVKGVSNFCKEVLSKLPGFRIEIEAGRVRLQHIFLARLWASEEAIGEIETLTYRKLIAVADEATVDAELCLT